MDLVAPLIFFNLYGLFFRCFYGVLVVFKNRREKIYKNYNIFYKIYKKCQIFSSRFFYSSDMY
jgi:hypothetical protein